MTTDSTTSPTAEDTQSGQCESWSCGAASPELTGGAGFTYEDDVASVYAAALLSETTAPGVPGRQVNAFLCSRGPGTPLDDVIVEAEGNDGVRMRLSLQVKRKLIISSAREQHGFQRHGIARSRDSHGSGVQAWPRPGGVVTGEIADGSKRSFETLCEWARADSDVAGFVKKLRTDGVAGEKEAHFDDVRKILSSKLPERSSMQLPIACFRTSC